MASRARADFDFDGARVLVTGGTRGIGAGIARAFVDAGAHVTITGTRPGVGDYDEDLSVYRYLRLRMTEAREIEAAAAALDGLDVLVNNAGANLPGGRDESEPDVYEESVRINLLGSYRLTHACRPLLAASDIAGGASVVSLASLAARFGVVTHEVPACDYRAMEAAVNARTKLLISESPTNPHMSVVDLERFAELGKKIGRAHV